ncbi:MAG TPA: serine/threonine-protein kinase [Kofleriaceae bacterium]|nr:serine/threonine-protein kinase [Kofleriaceae bacterium]
MERGYRSGTVLLEKYRVESVLGRGGMAIVLRATHLHLGEEVALKILLTDSTSPDLHARFLREAQAAVRLRGEHVARVLDVGRLVDGTPYTVMEYLRGTDLAGELRRRGALVPGEAVDYALQACEALAEAHAHGIIHRDIKPSNLFLTVRPDGTPLIKVLDFGISKAPVAGSLLTNTDTVMGTAGYMSPEQMKAARDVDARTDIWALGVVLYEMLSGRPPFYAEAFSAMVLMAATEPPPRLDPRLPRGLEDIVLRCLAKDRAGRFGSMGELALALAPYAREQRAAALVVDRTRMMRGGLPAATEPPPAAAHPDAATTLQGTAGARIAAKRFRYGLAGMVSLAGVIGAVVAIGLRGSQGVIALDPSVTGTPPAVPAASAPPPEPVAAPAQTSTLAAAPPAGSDPAAAEPAASPAAPAAPAAPTGQAKATEATEPQRDKRAACATLEAGRRWSELRDCAVELSALGARDDAAALRAKAVRETGNAAAADRLQAALRDGSLRDAARQLRSIAADSVYFAASSDALRAAETRAVDDGRRKAQGLAAGHDCAGLRRLAASAATPAVVAAVAAIKCTEAAAAPAPAAPAPAPAATGARSASACDPANVDALLVQAQSQAEAGSERAALALVVKALACRQDAEAYRAAAIYACGAHDLASARRYHARLPLQDQTAVETRCDLEGIKLVQ